MASNKIDSRQVRLVAATPMIGSSASDTLDTIFPKIDAELAKLFEDRNASMSGGGTISNTGGTSLAFTSNFLFAFNSSIAGATPYVISVDSSPWSFTADGKMAYITVTSRPSATATLTTNATSLPSVTSSNQEIFLLAKRIGTDIYLRNGIAIASGGSMQLNAVGATTFVDTSFAVNDAVDPTKQIKLDAGGTTGTSTTIAVTQTANRVFSLPDATTTGLGTDATQSVTNKTIDRALNTFVHDDEPNNLINLSLATSVAANALTIALKGKDAVDPSTTNPVVISFRNSTSATGTYTSRSVTGALSVVVPSGTTLGTQNAAEAWLWIHALDNAGTVELAISLTRFDDKGVHSTTAISGGSANNVLYSTTARTNVPTRLIGVIRITETTAGTWASNSTEVSVNVSNIVFPASASQVLTGGATGTYAVSTNPLPSYLKVTVVGGGSGGTGGSTNNATGPGGAGGGTAIKTIRTFGFSTAAYAVGGGGAGGGAGGGGGNAGTASTFGPFNGTTLTGNGGAGTGGTGTSGDINITGGDGTSASFANNTLRTLGGLGGDSSHGHGGIGGTGVNGGTASAGSAASGFGGGGGGGGASTAAQAGGGGGSGGIIIIEEYYV